MYFSKLTLDLGRLSTDNQIYLIRRGEYAIHQWLWKLFPGEERRNFLYREQIDKGRHCFYVLSSQKPQETDIFSLKIRSFDPQFYEQQKLIFSLRANPTICRNGKRHDIFMNARHSLTNVGSFDSTYDLRQQAAAHWLRGQGKIGGFLVVQSTFEAYVEHWFPGRSGNKVLFKSVDFRGILEVTDPKLFLDKMIQGYGKCRAFGCGLMLVRRLESNELDAS